MKNRLCYLRGNRGMIHIREEGETVRTGFNFYPKGSNQVGFVFRLGKFVACARYNKHLGKFKINRWS
jgi:hypothetical protein